MAITALFLLVRIREPISKDPAAGATASKKNRIMPRLVRTLTTNRRSFSTAGRGIVAHTRPRSMLESCWALPNNSLMELAQLSAD